MDYPLLIVEHSQPRLKVYSSHQGLLPWQVAIARHLGGWASYLIDKLHFESCLELHLTFHDRESIDYCYVKHDGETCKELTTNCWPTLNFANQCKHFYKDNPLAEWLAERRRAIANAITGEFRLVTSERPSIARLEILNSDYLKSNYDPLIGSACAQTAEWVKLPKCQDFWVISPC